MTLSVSVSADAIERFLTDKQIAPWYRPGLETRILPREISDDERDEMPEEWATRNFYPVSYPPTEQPPYSLCYAGRIGTSGWDYKNNLADFATFECDADHSNENSESDLQRIDDALGGLCDIRYSTGGKGRHYRVQFAEPVSIKNRQEYVALCRYVVSQLSQLTGIDLAKHICGVGCILWLYTSDPKPKSFESIYEQTELFTVPEGWEPPVRTSTVGDREVTADAEHQKIFDYMLSEGWAVRQHTTNDGSTCYALHTAGLKAAHTALNLRGTFDTVSPGRDRSTPNAFGFLKEGGGLHIFRFGSTDEPTWEKRQSDGCSYCWFNQFIPSKEGWAQLCATFQGIQHTTGSDNVWKVRDFEVAAKLCTAAGGTFPAPGVPDRPVIIALSKGSIIVEIAVTEGESPDEPWMERTQKAWACNIRLTLPTVDRSPSTVITHARVAFYWDDAGHQDGATMYYVQHDNGTWKLENKENMFASLVDYSMDYLKEWFKKLVTDPYRITTTPFQPESPEPKIWNRGFKFSVDPVRGPTGTVDDYKHFRMILDHTGKGIDDAVKADKWCQENGITNGGDFLFVHLATKCQNPGAHLPGLGFWSIENETGKSSYWDAITMLFEKGAAVAIDNALINSSGFNAELEGAVFYCIHETDLSKARSTALSRLKELVTADWITIHPKGRTPYSTRNWGCTIQTANELKCFVVGFGDKRFIIVPLYTIPVKDRLDWQTQLQPALEKERAAFLHALLEYQLPEPAPDSRCRLPILVTETKEQIIADGLPELTAEQEAIFATVLFLNNSGKWKGLLTLPEIRALFAAERNAPMLPDVPAFNMAWGRHWRQMELHFRQQELKPGCRQATSHVLGAWGFDA